ncbi:uncharacterized protein LOC135104623 [Scylla paramamosain]|uniref:uncharacterized protein LOC135104623 n=1 Tax=Scylla paramamosain TaxID=85552 RepID=UPI0030829AAE
MANQGNTLRHQMPPRPARSVPGVGHDIISRQAQSYTKSSQIRLGMGVIETGLRSLSDCGLEVLGMGVTQFGFRPGKSTADLLLFLSKDWQDALEEGLDTLVVALDIAGAFDRVWHAGLIEKLRAKGVQGDLLMLLEDYLQSRTIQRRALRLVATDEDQQHPTTQ